MKKAKYIIFAISSFMLMMPRVLANVNLQYVSCGDTHGIPAPIPLLTSILYTLLVIVAPIILIIFSVVALLKAVVAQKTEEIMKARTTLLKKLLATALIYLVAGVTQFVFTQAASEGERDTLANCISCFLYNSHCAESPQPWAPPNPPSADEDPDEE